MNNFRDKISYPCVLDHKPGFFLNWILYRFIRRVNLDENMREALKQMQKMGTVVYASKYGGLLDYILYHYNFRSKRLPYPKIALNRNIALLLPLTHLFKILFSQISSLFRYGRIPGPYETGFYSKAIKKGTPLILSLVDPKGFLRSFINSQQDPLVLLIETQKEMEKPVFIVPQFILYMKTPEKEHSNIIDILFGYKDKPGVIRKLVLFFRYHRSALIDFGRPMDLKAYLERQPSERSSAEMVTEIRQMLIESIDSQKRVALGPIMKSKQQSKEVVLLDKKVNEQIERMSSGNPKKIKQLRKKAGEHFDEIAADYNITYIRLFRVILSWLWKKLFEGVDVDQKGLAKVRECARKGTLIYIPSHKSHIDYLVLNDALFKHHMYIPRVAAGQNLAFWPMGHIFRKSGAFFIRRTFKGAKLYAEVFSRYIKALLQEGYPIEFYIEGGRSRNGKLVIPKTGFLSILLHAYQEGYCEDLIFVPTSIIYDRIMEESSYLKEIGGGKKEKENFRQLLKARNFLKKRYGKIYIRFSEPLSLNEYLSKMQIEPQDAHSDLAFELVRNINKVSLVTPLSLIGTAILTNHRKGFHIAEVTESAGMLMDFLKQNDAPMADTLNDLPKAVQETIALLTNWKIVDSMKDAPGEEEIFYFVEDDKKLELEYYKNSIIHFFIHNSFVAVSLLTGKEDIKKRSEILADYMYLEKILGNEFVSDNMDPEDKVGNITDYYHNSGLLSYSDSSEGYTITKSGFDNLPVWAALAKTFIESYWIAAVIMNQPKEKRGTGEALLKNMSYQGRRYLKMGVVEHIGAISRLNFKNATAFINRNIINGSDNAETDKHPSFENLTAFSKRLYELTHYGQ